MCIRDRSYYSVIGGWILKYGFSYATSMKAPADFAAFTAQTWEPIVWHGIFMLCTALICFFGVKGIERASKFMMPALFLILIVIIIRSVTLPNAGEGLSFIFSPNLDNFSLSSISAALGQVFYSLSLCMGITITYGSYLRKEEHIVRSCFTVAGLDTSIAVLAGIAIFPAVFSFGLKPEAGPTLIFETLPQVFGSFAGGGIFALLFFILVFFAAVTSSVAVSYTHLISLQPIIGMENPYRYRNKAQFPIGTDREGRPIAGFYAGRTHTIIPQEDCVLGVRENKAILEVILGFMEEFSIPAYREEEGSGLVRHVLIRYGFATKEIMVCVVINGCLLYTSRCV